MLKLTESVSSNSFGNRQENITPNFRDRRDLKILFKELEQTQGQPYGAHPAEISIVRNLLENTIDETEKNEQAIANMLQMVRAALQFTRANNCTDPRGYEASSYHDYDKKSVGTTILQRELKRVDSSEQGEAGEWFYDQKWYLSVATQPSFSVTAQTLVHHADNRTPIVYRHYDFTIMTPYPIIIVEGMIGKKFGDVIDSADIHTKFINNALNDCIIAAATMEDDWMEDNTEYLKLRLS